MRFTEEHDQLRQVVRKVVEDELNPHVDAWEAAGTFPAHEVFARLGGLGLLGLEYDPAYGGGGVDHSFTLVLGEELGRTDCAGVPMAIAVQASMATPALARFGSEDLKQQFLAPGDPRRAGVLDRGVRARRWVGRGRPAHPRPARTATTG